MKNIIFTIFLFLSYGALAQDSIGSGPTRFPHKFDAFPEPILVYSEGMTSRHVSQFLKELEENKNHYEEFWKSIPKSDRFGVALTCEEKCFMIAKVSKVCHGITFVSFKASGSLAFPKIEYSHSGMSTGEICDTFLGQ